MFNIYPCNNDKGKVLVEMNVELLACMMASFGQATQNTITSKLVDWSFAKGDADAVYSRTLNFGVTYPNSSSYAEAKKEIIIYLKDYIDNYNK